MEEAMNQIGERLRGISEELYIKRVVIFLLFTIFLLPLSAQDVGRNYVKSQRCLDADGSRRVTTVQYFDGLGRPSQQCTDGMGTSGRYVHTAACYFGTGYIKQDGLQYAVSPGQTPVQSPPRISTTRRTTSAISGRS